MSLYNVLFGEDTYADIFKKWLDLDGSDNKFPTGRYRDICLSDDGTKIILLTRNGAGNGTCGELEGCEKPNLERRMLGALRGWATFPLPLYMHELTAKQDPEMREQIELVKHAQTTPELQDLAGRVRHLTKYGLEGVAVSASGPGPGYEERLVLMGELDTRMTELDKGRKHNKECPAEINFNLTKHPLYINNYEDPKDHTYLNFEFRVPEEHIEIAKAFASKTLPAHTLSQKFGDLVDKIKRGEHDDPEVQRALAIGQEIANHLKKDESVIKV